MLIRITAPEHLAAPEIDLPMSKSIVNRLFILSPEKTLGETEKMGNLCEDIRTMASAVRCIVNAGDDEVTTLDLNASGTAMRFLTALCAVKKGEWVLTGSERLCQRPVKPLVDALRSVGADISYLGEEGFPPLRINGNDSLEGGDVEIDGRDSSQYVSALMLVSNHFKNGLDIKVEGNASAPYIEMTRKMMNSMEGLDMSAVEADWSAAAFWYEIMSIASATGKEGNGKILLRNINAESIQGDKVVVDFFERINRHTPQDAPLVLDCRNNPDVVQALGVACCMRNVPFRMTGVRNLRIKETDRLAAMQAELRKMGYMLRVDEDSIGWDGEKCDYSLPICIATYSDHRMAMAFAPCALRFGEIWMENPDVVEKSYPSFWHDICKVGFRVENI